MEEGLVNALIGLGIDTESLQLERVVLNKGTGGLSVYFLCQKTLSAQEKQAVSDSIHALLPELNVSVSFSDAAGQPAAPERA